MTPGQRRSRCSYPARIRRAGVARAVPCCPIFARSSPPSWQPIGLLMIAFAVVATFRVAQESRVGSLQADLAQRGQAAPPQTGQRRRGHRDAGATSRAAPSSARRRNKVRAGRRRSLGHSARAGDGARAGSSADRDRGAARGSDSAGGRSADRRAARRARACTRAKPIAPPPRKSAPESSPPRRARARRASRASARPRRRERSAREARPSPFNNGFGIRALAVLAAEARALEIPIRKHVREAIGCGELSRRPPPGARSPAQGVDEFRADLVAEPPHHAAIAPAAVGRAAPG